MLGWMLVIRIVPAAARRLKAGCSEIALYSSKGGEKLIITELHTLSYQHHRHPLVRVNSFFKI
jgi:hypothetical protein